jgi:uncharacterized glyoxalase superfamily protein PhnB
MDKPNTAPAKVISGVAPYLMVSDANAASEFYQAAFGAEEVARMAAPDGRLMHVHLYVNGASIMLSDPFPEHGHALKDPQAFTLHLQVERAEPWWDRAVKAGAEVAMPLQDMFWGDRYGSLKDPYGVSWSIGAHNKG